MPNLHIISQHGGSIGEVTKGLIPFLQKKFKVTEEFSDNNIPESGDILLMHFVNTAYITSRVFEHFKYRVLIQPIDGTDINSEFIELIDKFDLIIVPSTSNKSILIKNRILAFKIEVIPNYITKNDIFSKVEKSTFTFYTELYYQPRKNLNAIIDFYKSGFDSEDVELVVKCNFDKKALKQFKKDLNNYNTKSKVRFINGYLKDSELKDLWTNVDCYLNLSGIEGFGIPLLRFALNKIPVIAINNPDAGYIDFLPDEFLIDDFEFKESTDSEMYSENSRYAFANKERSIQILKKAYYERKSQILDIDHELYQKYNIHKIQEMYIEALNGYYKQIQKNSSLSLGNTPKIKYTSPYGTSGYAIAGKEYIKALDEVTDIKWNPMHFGDEYSIDEPLDGLQENQISKIFEHDAHIIHSTPEWWPDRIEEGTLNIGYTVWETDKIHPDWVGYINCVDVVLVPSQWNKDIFIKNGITKPIYVIPHIAPNVEVSKEPSDNTYRFYTIGQWTERKGIEKTIRAYLNTFTKDDDTELVLKTFLNNYSIQEQELTLRKVNTILNQYPNPARIKLIKHELTYEEIINLHRQNDCYISACRSEGWGLGAFEAALFKNPVIMTGFGGQAEFLDIHNELMVGYYMIPVESMGHIPWYLPDQKWADPNMYSFESKMLRSYQNKYSNYDYKINERFNSSLISNKILNIIQKHG